MSAYTKFHTSRKGWHDDACNKSVMLTFCRNALLFFKLRVHSKFVLQFIINVLSTDGTISLSVLCSQSSVFWSS